jgi:predicted transcriptional regulator
LALGIPTTVETIETIEKDKRRKTADVKKPDVVEKYIITKDPEMHPETVITWDVDARDAMHRYDRAMVTICQSIPEDLRGLYTRQPTKALRIAGLFASMAGSATITLSHYARAQAIMEIFRTELHHVYDTTTTTTVDTGARKSEDKVIQLIGANVNGVTKRDIYRRSHLDTATVEKTLQQLQDNGIVTRTNGPKTATYTLSTTYD